LRIWIDSFIQVPRHVPRFQELNKDFVPLLRSKSLIALYSTQPEHPVSSSAHSRTHARARTHAHARKETETDTEMETKIVLEADTEIETETETEVEMKTETPSIVVPR